MTDNRHHRNYTSVIEDDRHYEAERERLREECSTLFDEKVRSILELNGSSTPKGKMVRCCRCWLLLHFSCVYSIH
jgi:hypothetical protein